MVQVFWVPASSAALQISHSADVLVYSNSSSSSLTFLQLWVTRSLSGTTRSSYFSGKASHWWEDVKRHQSNGERQPLSCLNWAAESCTWTAARHETCESVSIFGLALPTWSWWRLLPSILSFSFFCLLFLLLFKLHIYDRVLKVKWEWANRFTFASIAGLHPRNIIYLDHKSARKKTKKAGKKEKRRHIHSKING